MTYDQIVEKIGCFTEQLRQIPQSFKSTVRDIRFTAGKPIVLFCGDRNIYLRKKGCVTYDPMDDCLVTTQKDIDEVFYRLCGYSVYSHISELQNGFISVEHGLRVGVSGTAVSENGVLKTVNAVTGLSVRIPREIRGCAEELLKGGLHPEKGVLIAGAPSSGKTTLLRDFARVLGNRGRRVVVLDERFELLSFGFDLGVCSDVLQGYPKTQGFSHALRCLSPEFILCDELGDSDLPAIQTAGFAGAALIATVHAENENALLRRPLCKVLISGGMFEYIVLLNRNLKRSKIIRAGDLLENRDGYFDFGMRDINRAV